MKILFAGPSIYKAEIDLTGVELRRPAAQGDLLQAVVDGATVIGLVDGNFEAIASVWHKEVLFAISEGVTVLGSSSMGALRAAECASFGMIPVGKIANEYASGERDDDADVALCHGPFELGSPPTTLAMVDVEATVIVMKKANCLKHDQAEEILECSRRIFFKDRDIDAIFSRFDASVVMKGLFKHHFVNQKQADALELIERLKTTPADRLEIVPDFKLETPSSWTRALKNSAPSPISLPVSG